MSHYKQVVRTLRSTIPSNLRNLTTNSLTAGFLLLGLSVSGAQAAVVAFVGDQAAWEAAAGGPVVLEDLNLTAPVSPILAFTISNGFPGAGFTAGPRPPGGGFELFFRDRADDSQTRPSRIRFLDEGVTAVGADWDLLYEGAGTGVRLLVTFVDSTTELIATEIPNNFSGNFFGIVSDVAISAIQMFEGTQIGSGNDANFETFQYDNIRFVSAVPIPAALPLFLSALAALGFIGRRKKQLAAA